MKLTNEEIAYLSAWSREEWEPDCYQRPAHQLQLAHGVPGGYLINLIKAWTKAEGKRDQDILAAADNATPSWPWKSRDDLWARLHEAKAQSSEDRTPRAKLPS